MGREATITPEQVHAIADAMKTEYKMIVDAGFIRELARLVKVGDRIDVTNAPTQADTTTPSYFVEGYTESIGLESHTLQLNVSRADAWVGTLILDDAVRGELDAYALAY